MTNKDKDVFWPSYVDLLTALFIVMLVLFVLSYKLLSDSKKTTEEELNKIKEIQKISENLPKNFFEYQPEFKRWTLIRQPQFPINSDQIPFSDYEFLTLIGQSLIQMVDSLQIKYRDDSLKYLIIIEGMSSKIGSKPDPNNLSYRRAKALVDFWTQNNIFFDKQVCELLVVGSGIEGIGRYPFDPPLFEQEKKNQRILIQLVPKSSKF